MQIATERIASDADTLELRTEDFETSLREARDTGDPATTRIIGFLREQGS